MKGTVYKSTGSWYFVKAENGKTYPCRIKGKFRLKGIKNTNPIAVGDHVIFEEENNSDEVTGIISKIEKRKNYIIRKSVNLSKQTHIIAANIDKAFLLVTLNNPPTSTVFIDRFLATAEAYRIKAVLLFHKIDTYTDDELDEIRFLAHVYRSIGYTCLGTSAETLKNIEEVKALMQGQVCLFSGHSGVGKSTIINLLAPELDLKTKRLSAQHNLGQHTTTNAEMYELKNNTHIIDTPGIKGFGLVDMEKDEIDSYFPEFLALKQDCKFNNCLHIKEPGCAVKKALDEGDIFWSRYESYLQILESENDNYRPDIHHKK